MIERLKQLSRNQFLRNVSTLAFGTIISQAFVIGTSPILTRLFSAEDFGMLSVFTSFTVFFAVVSTGRYELALGLPAKDSDASKIFKLILHIGFWVSLFYLIIIFFLKEIIHYTDKSGFLNGSTSYLAPVYIFFIALYSALCYWNQRKKNYKKITKANAIQVISAALISIFLGFLGWERGLIISLVLGIIIASIYLLFTEKELISEIIKAKEIFSAAEDYKSFPRFMIFSDLSLAASQQFIPILFSFLYTTGIVGYYSMANRMIRLPNIVITTAIGNVFRNDAIDEIRLKGNCRHLYVATFKKLILMSVPIYLFVFIFSPFLFSFFLGKEWETAGFFARILSVMLLFEFISTPLSSVFQIREKQKLLSRFQFFNAVIGGIGIYLGGKIFHNPSISLIIFASCSVVFNIFLMCFSFKYSLHD